MTRLALPTVTLCAASSVNVPATVAALRACLAQVDFAECLLLTDASAPTSDPAIQVVPVPRIESARGYSEFLLHDLADHVRTDHCLVVQWDGFILDARQWEPGFLSFDYIGAPWPQFSDGHDVGNGGFSLRSRKLLDACRDPRFRAGHPEDVAICRGNRQLLEQEHAIKFPGRATAERFSFERTNPAGQTFGFHGIFNMIPLLGPDRFWEIYCTLDHRSTALLDYGLLMRQLGTGRDAAARGSRLTLDLLRDFFKHRFRSRGTRRVLPANS